MQGLSQNKNLPEAAKRNDPNFSQKILEARRALGGEENIGNIEEEINKDNRFRLPGKNKEYTNEKPSETIRKNVVSSSPKTELKNQIETPGSQVQSAEEKEVERQRHLSLQKIKEETARKKREEEIKKQQRDAFLKRLATSTSSLSVSEEKEQKTKNKEVAEENKNIEQPSRIKTYKYDIADTVRSEKKSLSQISNEEKKKQRNVEGGVLYSSQNKSSGKKWFILIMSIFVVGILGAFAGSAMRMFKNSDTPVLVNREDLVPALIQPDTQKNIHLGVVGANALDTLVKEMSVKGVPNTIKNIYITKTIEIAPGGRREDIDVPAGINDLIFLWGNFMPNVFSRSLGDEFMLGIHTTPDGINIPFLVLTTSSHSQTLAGVLEWEETMLDDFYYLFGISAETISENANMVFQDKILSGKDARVLQNALGSETIIYSFISENMLVLTTQKETLAKIIERMVE